MDKFRKAFGRRYVILPVIHAANEDQALTNLDIARNAGADGVFLVNHHITYRRLFEIYEAAAVRHPGYWIGLNCLDLYTADAVEKIFSSYPDISGIWADNSQVSVFLPEQAIPRIIKRDFLDKMKGLYFGGVAFKYQQHVKNLEIAASLAADYVDIVTTSGDATGKAPELEKIQRIRSAIPVKPLAIASGIAPENVKSYLGVADCFIAATGISHNFDNLDPLRTKMLIETARK